MEEPDSVRPVLKFQIDALLRIGASGEPIAFDVALHRESRRVAVSRGNS
jgi:predicted component of type VI protein secretion system